MKKTLYILIAILSLFKFGLYAQQTCPTPIVNNAISGLPTVCAGSTEFSLMGSLPGGGINSYTYIWESSTNNSSWQTITSATHQNYTSPGITSATYYRRLVASGVCTEDTSNVAYVEVFALIMNNNITVAQSICNGTSTTLTGSLPSGGTGNYKYQWMSSTDGSYWNSIPGKTSQNYAVGILNDVYFRRIVVSGMCSNHSGSAYVEPVIMNNVVSPSQILCSAGTINISGSLPVGGNGSFTYSWQTAINNSWQSTGIITQDYPTTTLTTSRNFRRIVTSSGCTSTSSASFINISDNYSIASPTVTGCETNTVYNNITGSTVVGGFYLWQSSTDSTTWTNIPGGTLRNLSSDTLRQNTWFRRITTSDACGVVTSNTIQLSLNPIVTHNVIEGSQTICTSVNINLTGSMPSGGNGSFTYAWQISLNGVSGWQNISGTSQNLTYSVSGTRWFRRVVTSGGCVNTANPVMVTTISNSLNTAQSTICENSLYPQITGSVSGGSGTYAFSWQSSLDNSTWAIMSGITSQTLPMDTMRQSTWFRRLVSSGDCNNTSASVFRIMVPGITHNQISVSQTTACTAADLNLTGTIPSGGSNSNYNYSWQVSQNGIDSWNTVASINALYSGYVRRYVSNSGSVVCNSGSNVIPIHIDILQNEFISSGYTIGALSSTFSSLLDNNQESGKYCYGVLDSIRSHNVLMGNYHTNATYVWQMGSDTIHFADIPNSNVEILPWSSIGVPDTYAIRRIVQVGQCRDTSNWGGLVVHPQMFSNLPDSVFDLYVDLSNNLPTGGSSSLSYEYRFAADYFHLPYVNPSYNPSLGSSPGILQGIVSDNLLRGLQLRDGASNIFSFPFHTYINTDFNNCQDTSYTIVIDTTTYTPPILNEITLSGRPELPANSLVDSISGPYSGFIGQLNFQWQSRPLSSSVFTNIPGATNDIIMSVQVQESTCYRRLISYGTQVDISHEVCVQICNNTSISVDTTVYYHSATLNAPFENFPVSNNLLYGSFVRKYFRNGVHLSEYDQAPSIPVYPPYDSSYYFTRDTNIVCGGYIESNRTIFYSNPLCAESLIRIQGNHRNYQMCYEDSLFYNLILPPNCIISPSGIPTWVLKRFSPHGTSEVYMTSQSREFSMHLNQSFREVNGNYYFDNKGYLAVELNSVSILDTISGITYITCHPIVDSIVFWREQLTNDFPFFNPTYYEGESATLFFPGDACYLPGVGGVQWNGPNGFQSNDCIVKIPQLIPQSAGIYYMTIVDSVCNTTNGYQSQITVIPANIVRDTLFWVDVQLYQTNYYGSTMGKLYAIRNDGTLWCRRQSLNISHQSFDELGDHTFLISLDSTWSHFLDVGDGEEVFAEKKDGSLWLISSDASGVNIQYNFSQVSTVRNWRTDSYNRTGTYNLFTTSGSVLERIWSSLNSITSLFPVSAKKWMSGYILTGSGIVISPFNISIDNNQPVFLPNTTFYNMDGFRSNIDFEYGPLDDYNNLNTGYASLASDSTMYLTWPKFSYNRYTTQRINNLKWKRFIGNSLRHGSVSAIGTDGLLKRVPLFSNYAGNPYPSSGSINISEAPRFGYTGCNSCNNNNNTLFTPVILPYSEVTDSWSGYGIQGHYDGYMKNAVIHLNGKELCLELVGYGHDKYCITLPFVDLNFNPLGNNVIAASATICPGSVPVYLTGSTPTGGTGTYTYEWLSASTSIGPWNVVPSQVAQQFNLAGLTQDVFLRRLVFSATAKDSGNVASVIVTSPITGNIIQSGSTICADQGSVLLTGTTPSGGIGEYQYAWESSQDSIAWITMGSSSSQLVVAQGYYRRQVNSINTLCQNFSNISVIYSIQPLVSIQNPFVTICQGDSVTLIATGGITYLWSTSQTDSSIVVSTPGYYTVTGTDVNGCMSTDTSTVMMNPSPISTITPSGTITLCSGDSVTLNGPSGYGYQWNTGSQLQNLIVHTSGSYSLTVTDSMGCQGVSAPVWVQESIPIQNNTISASETICNGNNSYYVTGSIPSGGSGQYYYLWETSLDSIQWGTSYSQNIYGWPKFARRFVIDSISGCVSVSNTSYFHLVNAYPPIITIQPSGQVALCSGDSVIISATPGYIYQWNTGATNASIQVNTAGTYQVIVEDSLGCTTTSTITTVLSGSAPQVSISPGYQHTLCQGDSVQLFVSGADSYVWSTGDTTTSIWAKSAGSYSVVGTEMSGCSTQSGVASVMVNPLPMSTITPSGTITLCSGDSVTLNGSSGYGYQWNTGSQLQNLIVHTSGSFALTVTDSMGCQGVSNTVWIQLVSPAVLTASSNSPVTEGNPLNLSATEILNATYQWSGPQGFNSTQRNPIISSVALNQGGVYTVVMTDPNCGSQSTTVTVQVQQPQNCAPPVGSSNSPVCEGSVLYLNTPTVTGATYQWIGPNGFSSSVQNASLSNTTPSMSGQYTLMVLTPDCGTVTTILPVTIGGTLMGSNANNNGPLCSGGQLNLSASSVSGGSYLWNGPSGFTSGQQVSHLFNIQPTEAGVYTVVMSSPGCGSTTHTTNVQVNNSTVSIAGSNSPVCQGGVIYMSTTAISGATYSWSGPNGYASSIQNPSISNAQYSQSGDYTLSVTIPSCGTTVTVTNLQVGNSLGSVFASSNSPVCSGSSLYISATQVAGVSYSWSGPDGFTSSQYSDSVVSTGSQNAGSYVLTAQSPGCGSLTRTLNVSVINGAVLNAGSNSPICEGSNLNLSVNSVSGATYSWSGPNAFLANGQYASISNAGPIRTGIYTLSVNQPGCGIQTAQVSVTVGSNPSNVSVQSNSPVCSGGTLNLSASNINGATYSWTGPNSFTAGTQNTSRSNVQSSDAGAYACVISSPGCNSVTRNINVIVHNLSGLIAGGNTPICQEGSLYLNVNSISGATYSWVGPNNFASSIQNPAINNMQAPQAGVYTVTATHSTCGTQQATINIEVGTNTSQASAMSNSPVCLGNNLNLTAANRPGYTFVWSGPDGFASTEVQPVIPGASLLNAGVYTLDVSSPGCVSTTRTVTVSVSSQPSVTTGNNGPLCQGGVLYLNASSVSGGTYSWTGPNSFVSSVQSPSIMNVQPGNAGIYTLTVNTGSCGSVSSTTSVVVGVSLNQAVATGNSPVCSGGDLMLTASAGYSYSWSGPNGFVSTEAEPVITNVNTSHTGAYQVVISSTGCGTVSRTLNVSVVNQSVVSVGSNSPVCQGSPVYFSASNISGATYSWSGPNGFISSTRSPSISSAQVAHGGIYTLTVNTNSCGSSTATTTVEVGSSFTSVSMTGNTPLCTGGNLQLTATNLPGYTFSWTGPNGFVSTVAQPVVNNVSLLDAGLYAVVISSPGCGTASRSLNVAINTAPVVNPGSNSPICQGSPLYLSANNITGATYSWSGPNGFLSGSRSPAIGSATPAASGIYTLVVTTNSCGSVTETTSVLVGSALSSINALSNTPVCVGGNLNLTATDRPGYSFSWTGPNGFASTDAEPVITGLVSANHGQYTVVFTSPGCGTASRSANVVVNNPASVTAGNSSPVCAGSVVYMNASAPTGSTYAWAGPNAYFSTQQSPVLNPALLLHNGIYTMTATVPGCGLVDVTTTVTVLPCKYGAEETEESTEATEISVQTEAVVQIYPNPSEGNVWVEMTSVQAGTYTLDLYDVLGKRVMQKILTLENTSYSLELSLQHLPKGVYMVKVQGAGLEVQDRLILK